MPSDVSVALRLLRGFVRWQSALGTSDVRRRLCCCPTCVGPGANLHASCRRMQRWSSHGSPASPCSTGK
eukprot:14822041-Alexandrium_andersonii.AAC.1